MGNNMRYSRGPMMTRMPNTCDSCATPRMERNCDTCGTPRMERSCDSCGTPRMERNCDSCGTSRMERNCDDCEDCRQKRDELRGLPLAMAYVPWQEFGCTYEPMQGMHTGTIFPELDKPFYGRRGMR